MNMHKYMKELLLCDLCKKLTIQSQTYNTEISTKNCELLEKLLSCKQDSFSLTRIQK